ncbi:conserved hypothetical protein [Desulfosarcina cetonica]|uniref:hypothetical protein n=1 Tax=Desulfosarcina cetonica TaxID=90730 RepID=UPI0012EE4184|nr:hypothetical protein [Desulfosarcina cetonica]VTR66661.1 conserved hypothetical protein [Desulfosarcina cetonica]
MADKKQTAEENYPLDPVIVIDMSARPAHTNFSRHLTFEDHAGRRKRLKVAFKKTGSLRWESDAFPEGIDALKSLTDTGNRSYWDRMFLENRGGRTTLPIDRLRIVMRYQNPPGLSPSHLNHAEIPVVDYSVGMSLLAGRDEICLDEFARRSRYAWAGIEETDPAVIRMLAADLGKSGSDGRGQDPYGQNPKYGGAISLLCSEFVSWYYYELNIKVNGKSLRDITGTQQLHDLFKAEKTLYRYNSGTRLQAFVHAETNQEYTPKPGDYLERRGPDGAEHSMIIYRWLPGDPGASNTHDRYNRAIVFNGPWPVTLRLVRIHEDEKNDNKDFWLGKID